MDGEDVSLTDLGPLCRKANPSVRKGCGKRRLKFKHVPLHGCRAINEIWSMDFVFG